MDATSTNPSKKKRTMEDTSSTSKVNNNWKDEVSKLLRTADHSAAVELERDLAALLKQTRSCIESISANENAKGLNYNGSDALKCDCGHHFDPNGKFGSVCEFKDCHKNVCADCGDRCEGDCRKVWLCEDHLTKCGSCDETSWCAECATECMECSELTCDDCLVSCGYGGAVCCNNCQESRYDG